MAGVAVNMMGKAHVQSQTIKCYIWDHCKQAGVTYRTYGEFADDSKPNIPVLKDHFCPILYRMEFKCKRYNKIIINGKKNLIHWLR